MATALALGGCGGVARYAVRTLLGDETIDEVVTGWDVDAALSHAIRSETSAATPHGVEQLAGTIRVHRDRRWTDERRQSRITGDRGRNRVRRRLP